MTDEVTSIRDRAVLAVLNIKMPGNAKKDNGATKEVNDAHRVSAKMGAYRKKLYHADAFAALGTAVSAARTYFIGATLPWANNGARMLPTANILAYGEKMRQLEREFEDAADEFAQGHAMHVATAQRELGSLFDPADYPSASEIRQSFKFDTQFYKVPTGSDFRADVSDEAAAAIAEKIDRDLKEAAADATKELYGRMDKVIRHMATSLRDYVPAGPAETVLNDRGNPTKKVTQKAENVFRDSLVNNVRELVDVLPVLNIAGDDQLTAMVNRLRDELCVFDAETLRTADTLRDEVAQKAEKILESISEFLA